MKLATNGDETKLFESEFQWLITRLANKLPSRTDVIWGLKGLSITKVGTCEKKTLVSILTLPVSI